MYIQKHGVICTKTQTQIDKNTLKIVAQAIPYKMMVKISLPDPAHHRGPRRVAGAVAPRGIGTHRIGTLCVQGRENSTSHLRRSTIYINEPRPIATAVERQQRGGDEMT